MRWPGPDVGRVAFPASDTRTVIFPGSAREMVAFPPAPMFVVPIDAAASGAGTATAVLVTTPVYPMNIVGDGTAGVTVSGVAVFTAAASGVGEALAVFAQLIEAPASGVGTASVVVKPSIPLASSVSSTGTAAVIVKPVAAIVAAVTCEGIAGVGAWPAATMTAPVSSSGTAIAATTARSVVTASASGAGTATAAVTAVTFTPVGMLKSGSSSTVSSGSLNLVTGMVADPAFPGSTVASNGVTILQSKSDATITMSANCSNNFSTTVTVAAYKNGAQIGTALTRTGGSGTFTITGSVTGAAVTAGDVITMMASAANGTTTINVANTFLNVT